MENPADSRIRHLVERLHLYALQKRDHAAPGVETLLGRAGDSLQALLDEMRSLPVDAALAAREPNDLAEVRRQRPEGPRRLWDGFDQALYREKLEGALLGRLAGNILGAPVEGAPVEFMENLARENGDPFPPQDYWKSVPQPYELRSGVSPRLAYTRTGMDGVPVDDDIAYTLLGLFILEEFGPGFSTEDVGRAWHRYLPMAYTAEEVTLKNLQEGLPALQAGEKNNPFTGWIGADIRSDPWGYLVPGHPELAAALAHRDAILSHRREGLHGAMFFSAAISAAFAVSHPLEALRIGLTEIPAECRLARHVRWALEEASRLTDYRQARQAVEARFPGMSGAHTLNNACLTVFGLALGGTDLTRVIGGTVAMGLDNDCTAATAGSIVGAVVGRSGIPAHWTCRFNDTIHTYLNGVPRLAISDVLERFTRQAQRVLAWVPPSRQDERGNGE